ncbi:hypothetical protein BT69DRAFT_370621 [Atractiella rhizophila]|nr:hypothetical protein BT69DRAFT_370621 [Atractiella rhizophila]
MTRRQPDFLPYLLRRILEGSFEQLNDGFVTMEQAFRQEHRVFLNNLRLKKDGECSSWTIFPHASPSLSTVALLVDCT